MGNSDGSGVINGEFVYEDGDSGEPDMVGRAELSFGAYDGIDYNIMKLILFKMTTNQARGQ